MPVRRASGPRPVPSAGDSVDRDLGAWLAEIPGVDPGIEAGRMRLLRLGRQLERMLAKIAEAHGITLGDWETLSILRRSGQPYRLAPTGLARALGLTSGTMSVRLERLEQAGLVERTAGEGDARGRPVRLSAKGHRVWRTATDVRTRLEQALLGAALSRSDVRRLNGLLRRVMSAFESEFGAPPRRAEFRDATRPGGVGKPNSNAEVP